MSGQKWVFNHYLPTTLSSEYDGDGLKVKESNTVSSTTTNTYYLRSSVMGGAIIEELELGERRRLLNAARILLSDWPDRFVRFSTKHKVWGSLWLMHMEATNWRWDRRQRVAPFWYWSVVQQELHRPRYQPSAQEIRSAMKYLKRTRGKCSKKMLAEIFGMAVAYKRMSNTR
jgi:hypothetical protein